jgi:hypothetical protein
MVLLSTRTYLSAQFLATARHYASMAGAIEADPGRPSESVQEHRGHVLASVISSVSALEAAINELFCDAADNHLPRLVGLPQETVHLWAEMWRSGIPRTARYAILDKYDIALTLSRKERLDRSKDPVQSAAALITLRNALIHYEPEWLPSDATRGPDDEHRMSKLLKKRFPPNPLTGAGNPFYPDKALGSGCARWASEVVRTFCSHFTLRLGIKVLFA